MSDQEHRPLHTEGVISDYFVIETHILSTRSADAYKAVDKSRNMPICLWMLRHPLAVKSEAVRRFLDRMHRIDRIEPSITDMTAFGVDAEGSAFATFPSLDGCSVASGNIEIAEAERRFLSCVKMVAALHSHGVVCGDLCGDSFWVRRSGEMRFLALLGSFDSEAVATAMAPPIDTLAYLAPEQRGGGGIVPASDVFALGVLAYYLLTKDFPFGRGVAAMSSAFDLAAVKPLTEYGNVPPVWAQDVIMRCLSADPVRRYASALEVQEAITEIRNRVFSEESAPVSLNSQAVKTKKSEDGVQEFNSLPKQEKAKPVQKQKVNVSRNPAFILGVLSVLVAVSVLFLFGVFDTNPVKKKTTHLKDELQLHYDVVTDNKLKEAIDVLSEDEIAFAEKEAQLKKIENSDDPIAHEILVKNAKEAQTTKMRELSERAIINRARRLGLMRSAEQVRQWLRTIRGELPEAYEAMLKSLDKTLPMEARNSALRQAYATNPRVALRLAAALALDLEQLSEYQPVISQLVGDSLQFSDASKYSTLSLVLAYSDLALIFGEDVIQQREAIPDDDILWLLGILAERNDINVRAIASIAVERGILSPIRVFFLKMIRDRGDLSPDVLTALTHAAGGVLKVEDVGVFGRWYDVEVEKILLAVCADTDDSDVLVEAFDTLVARSLIVEPSAALVDWVRRNYWEERAEFAKVVGIFGNLDLLSAEDIEKSFVSFDKFVRDSDLIDILLESDHPVIVRLVVGKYSDLLGLGALLDLLDNSDKNVRITAVKALKGFNDIGALKLIIDHYERERDPDVRAVYKETFWVIKQREDKK